MLDLRAFKDIIFLSSVSFDELLQVLFSKEEFLKNFCSQGSNLDFFKV